MSSRISNVITEYFTEEEDADIKKNVGIFLSNYVNRFVNFHKLMKEKHATYPFRILNADRA